jgi:hypothetical protein
MGVRSDRFAGMKTGQIGRAGNVIVHKRDIDYSMYDLNCMCEVLFAPIKEEEVVVTEAPLKYKGMMVAYDGEDEKGAFVIVVTDNGKFERQSLDDPNYKMIQDWTSDLDGLPE